MDAPLRADAIQHQQRHTHYAEGILTLPTSCVSMAMNVWSPRLPPIPAASVWPGNLRNQPTQSCRRRNWPGPCTAPSRTGGREGEGLDGWRGCTGLNLKCGQQGDREGRSTWAGMRQIRQIHNIRQIHQIRQIQQTGVRQIPHPPRNPTAGRWSKAQGPPTFPLVRTKGSSSPAPLPHPNLPARHPASPTARAAVHSSCRRPKHAAPHAAPLPLALPPSARTVPSPLTHLSCCTFVV